MYNYIKFSSSEEEYQIIKRKISLCLFTLLVSTSCLPNLCYTSTSLQSKSTTEASVNISINDSLSNEDIYLIKENINNVLSSKYEIMKNGNTNNLNYIVKNSKLYELTNLSNNFEKEWYNKVNLKISNYISNVTINNIEKQSNDTYLIEITYDVEFKLLDCEDKSESLGEKYEIEVKNIDNNWYISKLINKEEDVISLQDKNPLNIALLKTNDSQDYNSIINSKIEHINDITQNIDSYFDEYNNVQNSIKNDINQYSLEKLSRSYSGYDSSGAVDYALKWAYGRNSTYIDYNDEDCTNFVSQCVYEGGGIPASSYWYANSPAWVNVNKFYTYMRNNGYISRNTSSSNARLGDIIQLYSSNKSTYSHSVIITGSLSGRWLYSSHSTNRRNYPLVNVYPSSIYTNIGYLKFWH